VLIGIIGTSEIARQHARAVIKFGHQVIFAKSDNSESLNTIKCRNEFPECPQVNLDTLLYKHDCDSIISCLPVSLVDHYFDELYAYNKAILFEKPPYLNKTSFLVQSDKNTMHRVGFNKRFFTSVQALKNKVMQEAPIHVALTISESSSAHKYDRLNFRKLNYLYYSSSSHLLDLALYLFGASDKVNFRSVTNKSGNHYGYVGTIEFFNGVFAGVSILVDDPVRIGISCFFVNGERWILSPLEQLTTYKGYDISVRQNINTYKPRVESWVKTDINSEIKPGIEEQMKAFVNKVDGTLATFSQYQNFVSLVSKISNS